MHLQTVQLKWTLKVTSQVTIYPGLPLWSCPTPLWQQDSEVPSTSLKDLTSRQPGWELSDFLQAKRAPNPHPWIFSKKVWSGPLLNLPCYWDCFNSTNTYKVPTVCQALVLQLWYRATPFFSRSAIPVGWSKLTPRQDQCIAQTRHLVLCSGQYTVIQL